MSPIRPMRHFVSSIFLGLAFSLSAFGSARVDALVTQFLNAPEKASAGPAISKAPIVVILKSQPTVANIIKTHRFSGDAEHFKAQVFQLLEQQVDIEQLQVRDLCDQLSRTGQAEDVGYLFLANVVMLKASKVAIRQLQTHPDVAQIIGDHDHVFSIDPRDIQVHETAQEDKPYGLALIKSDQANAKGYKGKGVVVAVTDTGIDLDHPAFAQGQVLTEKCKSFVPGETTAEDGNGHGTHCAGTIGGQSVGVAPDVQLIGVKVLSASGSGSWRSVAEGVQYAAQNAQVVSMSLGGPSSAEGNIVEVAVKNAIEAGVTFSIAAGNSGPSSKTIGSPGAVTEAITLGAVDSSNNLASFSSRGQSVYGKDKPDVSAPGVAVYSAWKNGGWATISGTSMATPHNAGAIALLKGANKNLPPADIKKLLVAHGFGKKVPNQDGAGTIDCVGSLSEIAI